MITATITTITRANAEAIPGFARPTSLVSVFAISSEATMLPWLTSAAIVA